jgi:hypothetical protein
VNITIVFHTLTSTFPDHVFNVEARNRDVYNRCAKHVVDSCLEGYNGVIFA